MSSDVASNNDAQLQELLDKQALLELVIRYCRAVDRCDFDLLLSCYHPEAIDDHATFVGRPADMFPPILERMRQLPPTQHIISNAVFEIRGDEAMGEIYTGVRSSDANGEYKHGGFGRSLDRYERRDGTWRIAHRKVIIEWFDPGPGRERPALDVTKKSREDPSYDRQWS